jgi:hypothetical protein
VKKTLYLIAIICLLALSGCEKPFDIKPPHAVIPSVEVKDIAPYTVGFSAIDSDTAETLAFNIQVFGGVYSVKKGEAICFRDINEKEINYTIQSGGYENTSGMVYSANTVYMIRMCKNVK